MSKLKIREPNALRVCVDSGSEVCSHVIIIHIYVVRRDMYNVCRYVYENSTIERVNFHVYVVRTLLASA